MSDCAQPHQSSRQVAASDATEPGLQADAALDASFAVPPCAAAFSAEPREILLTGASGFLGAFVLDALIRETSARVRCLVRAPAPAAAFERLVLSRRRFGVDGDLPRDRVEAVCGDLALPGLGISEAEHAALARNADTIIHVGAAMNFYQSYEALRPANVGGTGEILRLAVRDHTKVLHYVSSSGVFEARSYLGMTVRESDQPARCDHSVTGYTQSKWVAERLVAAARGRGLPVCIHRPPFITGHSVTGAVDFDNLMTRMMVGCIQGGSWPDESAPVDLVPVDYVSGGLVRILCRPECIGRTFHYAGRRSLQWADIGRALRDCGFALDLPPFGEWKREMRRFVRSRDNALRPLAPFFLKTNPRLAEPSPDAFIEPRRPRFDGAATRELLAGLGVEAPDLDTPLFVTYCDYFQRSGWVQRPSEKKASAGTAHPDA